MSETQLSTDFAARVLEAADRFAARRRRVLIVQEAAGGAIQKNGVILFEVHFCHVHFI